MEAMASEMAWFTVGETDAVFSFLKSHRVKQAVFAGKIDPRVIFRDPKMKTLLGALMPPGQARNPENLIRLAIDYFSSRGISIIQPLSFLAAFLCRPGVLTRTVPSADVQADIEFAWGMARELADLDIGQSLVVKDKQVVAVEGIEGTDETIRRAGGLAGEGTVLVKVARTRQDARIDLPAVGLKTIEALVAARASALCFEAEQMPFFQREQAIALADGHDLAIVSRK